MKPEDGAALMAAHDLFRVLPAEAQLHLAAQARFETFPAETLLFQEGDEGDGCYLILSGKIRVHVSETDGKDMLIVQLGAGDLLGEMALLDGGPRSASATTMAPAQTLFISRASFDALLEEHPLFMKPLLRLLTGRLRATVSQLTAIALLDLPARLASFLLQQAARLGCRVKGGTFSLGMKQSELADHLATSRESVNKLLNTWQTQGVIRLLPSRAIFIEDLESLEALVSQRHDHD